MKKHNELLHRAGHNAQHRFGSATPADTLELLDRRAACRHVVATAGVDCSTGQCRASEASSGGRRGWCDQQCALGARHRQCMGLGWIGLWRWQPAAPAHSALPRRRPTMPRGAKHCAKHYTATHTAIYTKPRTTPPLVCLGCHVHSAPHRFQQRHAYSFHQLANSSSDRRPLPSLSKNRMTSCSSSCAAKISETEVSVRGIARHGGAPALAATYREAPTAL